ncbi:UTP--glucose-1-phosphate uridylyltransferase GalU [Brochothrix thermosphacta]|mgnify:FL=1|uniref:UTP--glucose-1-phosphate uridylyltransferase n=1 Tax=Brochothrix thermosphacta TaxID=2756 RepID=A0A2X0QG08_BROTH|nr:UTP--glucose-1-phosphate uridylyltransferase GalU [Brochothrix thermosphacta]ODJ58810.1 UTP--glucose-1-phosphate uridylyltransferase [Brochothrix thermosphacta]ODJ61183.1 UTP--glucose-1-phosphate uridylyltransferase [Brochothrix thermosphacta]ODJ68705.1 UTP--glucose-1-phosphate uridylyltransferase [Brochothrix thermosphacta]SOC16220.1 UTP-glucose-1-phosphate uridylyltransferase [Brochothrix thermosphacta]SPN72911.1 UTP-glucose-1-phosphate uridylyltransferase [Brochothrix thermosphacta]
MKVKKAIIPAAGLGTRFLPATKATAKEMLPIIDKPTIQYIVEEAVASGIEDILIITGKGKRSIEDHFDTAPELEQNLLSKNKLDMLAMVQETSKINIHFIRQKSPRGLGDAILQAKGFVGNEPFVVLLGDDIVKSETPCVKQLINQYDKTKNSIIGVQTVPLEDTNRYGIIDPESELDDKLYNVRGFVEKPDVEDAPSQLAILGRYLLTPEIFALLETQEAGAGDEIQLTDAIDRLNKTQRVLAYEFEGRRYDVGDKFGFVDTTLRFALDHPEIKERVQDLINELAVDK